MKYATHPDTLLADIRECKRNDLEPLSLHLTYADMVTMSTNHYLMVSQLRETRGRYVIYDLVVYVDVPDNDLSYILTA